MFRVSIDLIGQVIETPDMYASFDRANWPRFAEVLNHVLSETPPAGVTWDIDLTWTVRSTGKLDRSFRDEDVQIVREIINDHLLP